jgi:hypothetical protein
MAKQLKLRPVNARRGKPADTYALPHGKYWTPGINGETLCIEVSEGKAGVAVCVQTFGSSAKLSLTECLDLRPGAPEFVAPAETFSEVCVCQYRSDPKSQAFARWYQGRETDADVALLGPEYKRREVAP